MVHSDLSPALIDIPPAPRRAGVFQAQPWRPIPRSNPADRPVAGELDSVLQTSGFPSLDAPAAGTQFNGIGSNNGFTVQSAPPDTNGDVSSLYYVQTVNSDFAVFNKTTGAYVYGPVTINTLWSGFGGGCQTNNDGDPTVTYDQLADRWIITQFSVSTTPYLECVAVSQTNNPTGSWYRYSYSYGNTNFPDYPKFGMMSDGGSMNAYFITYNIFANGSTFSGSDICAYDRAKMLTGAANSMICQMTTSSFGGALAADLDGSTLAPSGSPEFIVSTDAAGTGLNYWTAVPNFSTSTMTLTNKGALAVAAYTQACSGGTCIPQGGVTQKLDSLADRLMNRLQYRNFGGSPKLVVSHSVGSSVSGARWYQFSASGSTLSVAQQGTFSPDSTYRWMPSIAMDQSQDIGLGYSTSSGTLKPGVAFTVHAAADAANTMQTETVAFTGGGSQTGSSLSRWGDYANMSVDPADDCTFWFTTEYIPSNGAFNWATRIVSFKVSTCGGGTGDTTPPTTSLTAPAAGTVSGTITVSANASDNVGVTNVEFYAGASLIGSDSSSPYSISWNTTTVANGTYTLTSKAYDAAGNSASSAGVSVTVSNAVVTGIVNGTFETGNLTGWTSAGTTGVLTGTVHGGTYADRNGSTVATNGDSNIVQTFTVPAGGGTVSFWYKMTCPDTITYDWVTATLKDNTTAVTTTLLPKTCATNASWVQVTSAAQTAGHSVTLTLTSHDDNYASDPSYTYFDDVTFNGTVVDTTAPTTSLTAPAAGTVSGTITVSANASDNVGVTKVEFYAGAALIGTDTTTPYSISWNTTTVANGNYTLTSKAYDAANNIGTSAGVVVTVSNVAGAPDLTATYNTTYKTTACPAGGKSCDTGATLVNGRGTMTSGNELNRPNTLNASCADGNSGTYHSDESLDRVKIATNDGTALAAGKAVTITFTAYCYSSTDKLDVYYATNVTTPSWVLIGTQSCTAAGVKAFTASYTLPSGSTTQAVRGNLRYSTTAGSCTAGAYDDRDDLVFGVN